MTAHDQGNAAEEKDKLRLHREVERDESIEAIVIAAFSLEAYLNRVISQNASFSPEVRERLLWRTPSEKIDELLQGLRIPIESIRPNPRDQMLSLFSWRNELAHQHPKMGAILINPCLRHGEPRIRAMMFWRMAQFAVNAVSDSARKLNELNPQAFGWLPEKKGPEQTLKVPPNLPKHEISG